MSGRYRWYGPKVSAALDKRIVAMLTAAAIVVQDKAKVLLSIAGTGVRAAKLLRKVGGGGGGKGRHPPSEAAQGRANRKVMKRAIGRLRAHYRKHATYDNVGGKAKRIYV